MSIDNCHLISLPRFIDQRGSLTVIENTDNIPFIIKRIFYLYDVPDTMARADHANIKLQQVLIAIAGSFRVMVDDGVRRHYYILNEKHQGLFIPGMIWRVIDNFSPDAVCMVLCSDHYDTKDYYHHYEEYCLAVKDIK
ncbi:MAG: FdtA/QdtA family cupin domain-containing protein [Chloroflexi bacterium]|nr:FdtA/QdtA family cupin domain-containing protein [Chloroflexota bacterium]